MGFDDAIKTIVEFERKMEKIIASLHRSMGMGRRIDVIR